jgi:MFS-type transporter involved in bile tolerance (Atg22 family)
MKKIGFLFAMTFIFFLLAQILWTIALIIEEPLFGSKTAEDWSINIPYSLCSIFGLIASINLFKIKNQTK